MTDFTWPADLVPYQQLFYLQPHVGRSESPFTRQQKIYGLSAPRWICRMSFRGGYDGTIAQAAYGPRLDAFLAKLKGGQNRVAIHDFRRSRMRAEFWSFTAGNEAADAGDSQLVITGLAPSARVLAGDYVGGDGRPHIITDDAAADAAGEATVSFEPPLANDIAEDEAVFGNPAGWFRLTSEDAGSNGVTVGELVAYDLEFVEDL